MRFTLQDTMTITIENVGLAARERLRQRLEHASRLYCIEHGQSVVAVTIYGRENGWFDARWTTCCEGLERQAAAIVKDRC